MYTLNFVYSSKSGVRASDTHTWKEKPGRGSPWQGSHKSTPREDDGQETLSETGILLCLELKFGTVSLVATKRTLYLIHLHLSQTFSKAQTTQSSARSQWQGD